MFCDFRKFSAKNLAFFKETNVMIKFLQKEAVFLAKTPILAHVLAKILKNHNIDPCSVLETKIFLNSHI
jgi:hypothetical protein